MSFTDVIGRADASALIPTQLVQEIIKAAAAESVALSLGRRVQMSSHQAVQPVLALLPEAYWVDGDGGLKQTTKAGFEGLVLTAEELACVVPVRANVFYDSSFNLWSELRDPIAAAIGAKLDAAALLGLERPTSWPPSVLEGATAAANVAESGATDQEGSVYGDLEKTLALVEDDGFAPDNFVGAPRLRRRLRQARSTIGNLLGEGGTASAWDLPVTYTPLIGSPNLALTGDFRMLVIGIRQDVSYQVFDQAVITNPDGKVTLNLMQEDSLALRVVFRAGCVIANPATVENPDADTRYPFAVLADPDPGTETQAGEEDAAEAVASSERQPPRAAGKR